jgi:hypothetical protein
MSEYAPISSANELDLVDDAECLDGYLAGLKGTPEPGSDKSKSFWHGWRNGMIDKGRLPSDYAAQRLATEVIRRQRAH